MSERPWNPVPLTADDLVAHHRLGELGWSGRSSTDEEKAWQHRIYGTDRFVGVHDPQSGELIGTSGWYDRELTVPGLASVPVLGLTEVAVLPTHRRRGVLRSMVGAHVDIVREQGAVASVLSASDAAIYERFGFGPAALRARWELPSSAELRADRRAATAASGGNLRLLADDEVPVVLAPLHERHRRACVGDITRPAVHWEAVAANVELGGGSPGEYDLYHVVCESDGEVRGYASYRLQLDWSLSTITGVVVVEELIALDGQAEVELLRYVLDLDLTDRVLLRGRPSDDRLRWHLVAPRRLRPSDLGDALWLRIVDVVGALSARRYAAPGVAVIEVVDPVEPGLGGRFRLEVDASGAVMVERTSVDPDVTMGMADLSACYLGGSLVSDRSWVGGVVEHHAGAVAELDRLLMTPRQPWCTTFVY